MAKTRAEQKETKSKLPISPEYASKFQELKTGEQLMLRDNESAAKARVQIRAKECDVYYARPDGEIIPEVRGVRRADYVIYCCSKHQVSFIEMKGQNIQLSEDKSPHAQILSTLEYFSNDEGLKNLVSSRVEKHAFIVSALRQRIPSGISISERKLLYRLGAGNQKSDDAREYLHYVRYIQKGRYSDKDGHIVCSSEKPLEFPYEQND